MRRDVPLILLLVLSQACDKEPAKEKTNVGELPPKPPPKPGPLPTTGSPRIRESRESLVEEIERAEKDLENGTKPPAHLLYGWKGTVDNLIIATERAIQEEAVQAVRSELSALRERQGRIDKSRTDLNAAMTEIQGHLDRIQAGGKPPEGFTEDELRDKFGQRQEEVRALDKEEEDVRARMKEKEEILSSGKPPPPQGATLYTHELEALKALKERIVALEAKAK